MLSRTIQTLQEEQPSDADVEAARLCPTCSKRRPTLDWGFDSPTGRIDGEHCRCDVVIVPFQKKVFYKNKDGDEKDKMEFVDVECECVPSIRNKILCSLFLACKTGTINHVR